MRKKTFFQIPLSCVVFFALLIPASADTKKALKLFKQNRLYEALSMIEKPSNMEDYYLKAKIFHRVGIMANRLYYLSFKEIHPYIKILKDDKRKIGDEGWRLKIKIKKLNNERRYEEALKIIQEFQKEARKTNNLEKGIRYFSPALYIGIAKTYIKLSIENYEKAIILGEKQKRYVDVFNRLIGECYFEIEDYHSALKYYNEVDLNDIKKFNSFTVHLWYSYIKTNNQKISKEVLNKLTQRFSNNMVFRSELGYYMYLSGKKEEGIKLIKEAYKGKVEEIRRRYGKLSFNNIEKGDYPIFRNHGIINKNMKNYKAAITDMELIVNHPFSIYDNDPILLIELSGVYLYPRMFNHVLMLLNELQLYFPEVNPLWNIMMLIAQTH